MLLQHQQPFLCAGRAGGRGGALCNLWHVPGIDREMETGVVRVARAYGDRTC